MLSDTCPLIVRGLVSLNLDSYSNFCTPSCCNYNNLSVTMSLYLVPACFVYGWAVRFFWVVGNPALFG